MSLLATLGRASHASITTRRSRLMTSDATARVTAESDTSLFPREIRDCSSPTGGASFKPNWAEFNITVELEDLRRVRHTNWIEYRAWKWKTTDELATNSGELQDGEWTNRWASTDARRSTYVSSRESNTTMTSSTTTDQRPRLLTFLALTFLAMVVWPLLGIAASYSMFSKPTEAVLLFGGLAGVLLLPLYMVVTLSESAFGIAIMTIWMLTWIGPSLWFVSRTRTRRLRFTLVAILSGISLFQSALGFLMILGKNV